MSQAILSRPTNHAIAHLLKTASERWRMLRAEQVRTCSLLWRAKGRRSSASAPRSCGGPGAKCQESGAAKREA